MNLIYKKMLVLTAHSSDQIFNLMERSGHDFSRNWVRGWALGEDSRNFRKMTEHELLLVLDALIENDYTK